jgi:hypothetical protein
MSCVDVVMDATGCYNKTLWILLDLNTTVAEEHKS